MKNLFLVIAFAILIIGCKKEEEQVKEKLALTNLQWQPKMDTIFLNANNETRSLSLVGTQLNESNVTIKNSGMIADASFIVHYVDTVQQNIDPARAQWSSTNISVASVDNGKVTAHNPGTATVIASVENVSTSPLVVNVRAVDTAPGLLLDPPASMIVFENSASVSGSVQTSSKLIITESRSGFANNNVSYLPQNGIFSMTIPNIQTGVSTISVTAMHPTRTDLFTTRTKTVYYYTFGSTEANQLVGNWKGTTLGYNFFFTISNSIIPTRYDIQGKIDIQFEGLGFVRDIDIIGVLGSNGKINATLSKNYQGFSIKGSFSGLFLTTGTAQGAYSASAEKSGFPKLSFDDVWTAVKINP